MEFGSVIDRFTFSTVPLAVVIVFGTQKVSFLNACISDADLVRQDLIVAWSFWKREKRETPRTIYMHQFELPGEDVDSTQSTPIQASPDELGATQ